MADSESVDTTQQVTSKTPDTKRVAAGNAERTRQAREANKKLLAEAQAIIANSQLKRAETPVDTLSAEPAKNVLTTIQWLSIIGIVVSLVEIYYYKREEIKPPPAPPPPKKGINHIITKALSDLYGNLPRDCFLAVAKAIEKHVDFSHDSDGYPIDEVDNAEQSSANAE